MWVYKTGRSEEKKMVLYQFENDRKYDRASDYLEGFNGVIQSDGYQAYANIKDIKNMGCFAHIRRKLVEVMDVAPKGTVIKETQTYKTVAPHTPKKSHLDTAMTYAINNEKYLRYYIEDGRVEISNNSAERCCKSFVIGRKNFLFSNSINGAKASGAAYSIIESAKINGLKPYEYIEYILTRMTGNKLTADLLKKIMPWSEELPKNLYKNKKA